MSGPDESNSEYHYYKLTQKDRDIANADGHPIFPKALSEFVWPGPRYTGPDAFRNIGILTIDLRNITTAEINQITNALNQSASIIYKVVIDLSDISEDNLQLLKHKAPKQVAFTENDEAFKEAKIQQWQEKYQESTKQFKKHWVRNLFGLFGHPKPILDSELIKPEEFKGNESRQTHFGRKRG